jgi:hypothetical protein
MNLHKVRTINEFLCNSIMTKWQCTTVTVRPQLYVTRMHMAHTTETEKARRLPPKIITKFAL